MPTDILSLPPAERDKLAAEKILNRNCRAFWRDDKTGNSGYECTLRCASADHDYLILKQVRETWSVERQTAFVVNLQFRASARARAAFGIPKYESLSPTWMPLYYEPGDYRDAALAVLAESGEL